MYFGLLSATLPLLDKVMLDYVTEIPCMGSKAFRTQRVWATYGYLITNFAVEACIARNKKNTYNYGNMQFFNFFAVSLAAICIYLFVANLPRISTSVDYSSSVRLLFRTTNTPISYSSSFFVEYPGLL